MAYHNCQFFNEGPDELRGKFTSWLDTVLPRAQNKYINASAKHPKVVSLSEEMLDIIADPINPYEALERPKNAFDFQEARLAAAFQELPLMRKEVLRLMFVEEMPTKEIAARLHISEEYVRQQKHRAFQKLRNSLAEGGDSPDDER